MLFNNFISLFMESATWLLVGYIIAVILKYMLPQKWLVKHLGNSRHFTTIKAAIIGSPLPLCSCGVIPVALSLRRAGASKSATTAFLIATPETGVDSVAISYALLGPVMAIIRPIAAICSAIVAGLLVTLNTSKEQEDEVQKEILQKPSCCLKADQYLKKKPKSRQYFDTLIDFFMDSYKWLLIGLFFAALMQTFVPQDFLFKWGRGWSGMFLMAIIGIPMYICATSSTPIATGLILAGVSPGAALVFMLTGPATNIATLMIVRQELGKNALLAYLVGVLVTAVSFGFATDALTQMIGWLPKQSSHLFNSSNEPWWVYLSSIILALLMLYTAWKELQALRLKKR